MIEMQTMRSVSKSEPPVRRPTRTDAMMSMEMINAALSDLGAELVHSQDVRWSAGFVYASFVEEAGTLDLMLEDVAYRLLECTLQIGTTKRTGRVLLALPAEGRGPRPRPRRDATEPDIRAAEAWTAEVCETVMHVEAPIEGVVGRIRMPLNKILSLGLDDVLPIENGGVDDVSLEAAGGTRIALCRLGQNRGMRALRLRNIEDPNQSSFGALPHMPDAPASDQQKATLSQSARTKAVSTAESASS
jgi:flagellar motor switch protein FliM